MYVSIDIGTRDSPNLGGGRIRSGRHEALFFQSDCVLSGIYYIILYIIGLIEWKQLFPIAGCVNFAHKLRTNILNMHMINGKNEDSKKSTENAI